MKKEVTICYSYKEDNVWWLVFGTEEDFFDPEEKSFPTKKDLNKWVKENLDVIK